jgi:hypothetical protein
MCHIVDCTHFRACCDFSYVKHETIKALLVTKPHAGEFHCHCGWTTPCFAGVGYADPPQCGVCQCYMMFPSDKPGDDYWGTGKHCIVEKRKRYPQLHKVVEYIDSLPHKKESYVHMKVGKEFALASLY